MDDRATFTSAELNLLQQWFNAVHDLNPGYLEDADRALVNKILHLLGPEWEPRRITNRRRARPSRSA